MRKNSLLTVFSIFGLITLQAHAESFSDQANEKSDVIKRLEVSPQPQQASVYQGREFHPGGHFSEKIFPTKNDHEPNSLSTTIYPTRSFFGITNPWLGKKIFATGKFFSGNQLSTKIYPLLEKQNSYSKVQAFSAYPAALDPKAQGGLDHDETLQQALKKNMTPGQVRELINSQL